MRFPPHKPGSLAAEAVKGARRRPPRPLLTQPVQLTKSERRALRASTAQGGTLAAGVHATVRGRLTQAGWVVQPDQALIATKEGRKALTAVLPEKERGGVLTDVYLKTTEGFTTIPSRSVQGAGIVIDPATLKDYWAHEAERRAHQAADARDEARKLADRARKAA